MDATGQPETYPTPAQVWRNKTRVCEDCHLRAANYGLTTEARRRWCARCAANHGASLRCKGPSSLCLDCGAKLPSYGILGDAKSKWCMPCAHANHPDAVYLRASKRTLAAQTLDNDGTPHAEESLESGEAQCDGKNKEGTAKKRGRPKGKRNGSTSPKQVGRKTQMCQDCAQRNVEKCANYGMHEGGKRCARKLIGISSCFCRCCVCVAALLTCIVVRTDAGARCAQKITRARSVSITRNAKGAVCRSAGAPLKRNGRVLSPRARPSAGTLDNYITYL